MARREAEHTLWRSLADGPADDSLANTLTKGAAGCPMTPKPVLKTIKPGSERRPRFVTAIVGILQNDGVVLGAESEETARFKRSVFKIPLSRNQRGEYLIVGGVGAGYMIDTITQRLSKCFKSLQHNNSDGLFRLFEPIIHDFHSQDVLKWPTQEEREQNEFDLLLGLCIKSETGRPSFHLWAAQGGILRNAGRSFAIGIGAEYASLYLDNLRGMYSLETAALVAIHVLLKVKKTQPNCGKETAVWIVSENYASQVFEDYLNQLEELSSRFDFECDKLFLTAFSEPSKAEGADDENQDKNILKDIHSLRDEYRKATSEFHALYRPPRRHKTSS